MKKVTRYFLIAGILFAAACGTTTTFVSTWKNKEDSHKKVEKLGITALFPNESNRYIIERALAQEFKDKKINAVTTYDTWPLAGRIGENPQIIKDSEALKAKVKAKVAEQDFDAIMFITVARENRQERYVNSNDFYLGGPGYYGVPAAVGYFGSPYGAYYNYYAYTTGTIYDTGYYVEDVTYYIDCKLYDTEKDDLLWTGQTKTVRLDSVDEEAMKFAKLIVDKIMSQKVIIP